MLAIECHKRFVHITIKFELIKYSFVVNECHFKESCNIRVLCNIRQSRFDTISNAISSYVIFLLHFQFSCDNFSTNFHSLVVREKLFSVSFFVNFVTYIHFSETIQNIEMNGAMYKHT